MHALICSYFTLQLKDIVLLISIYHRLWPLKYLKINLEVLQLEGDLNNPAIGSMGLLGLDFCGLFSPHPGTCMLGLLTSSYLATTAMATATAPATYNAGE